MSSFNIFEKKKKMENIILKFLRHHAKIYFLTINTSYTQQESSSKLQVPIMLFFQLMG